MLCFAWFANFMCPLSLFFMTKRSYSSWSHSLPVRRKLLRMVESEYTRSIAAISLRLYFIISLFMPFFSWSSMVFPLPVVGNPRKWCECDFQLLIWCAWVDWHARIRANFEFEFEFRFVFFLLFSSSIRLIAFVGVKFFIFMLILKYILFCLNFISFFNHYEFSWNCRNNR